MLIEFYTKQLEKNGQYKIGRTKMYRWFGIIACCLAIIMPTANYLLTGDANISNQIVLWSAVMVSIGIIMFMQDRKVPNKTLSIDKEGITTIDGKLILWKDVRSVIESQSPLAAPNAKGFNFIAKSNHFINIKMNDGTSCSLSLDGLSFNPLKLITAFDLFSGKSQSDPKKEEYAFIKLVVLSIIAIIGLIVFLAFIK